MHQVPKPFHMVNLRRKRRRKLLLKLVVQFHAMDHAQLKESKLLMLLLAHMVLEHFTDYSMMLTFMQTLRELQNQPDIQAINQSVTNQLKVLKFQRVRLSLMQENQRVMMVLLLLPLQLKELLLLLQLQLQKLPFKFQVMRKMSSRVLTPLNHQLKVHQLDKLYGISQRKVEDHMQIFTLLVNQKDTSNTNQSYSEKKKEPLLMLKLPLKTQELLQVKLLIQN